MSATLLACALLFAPQVQAQTQPVSAAEGVKKLSFLTGAFEGTTIFTLPGGEIKSPTTSKGIEAIKGTYFEVKINYDLSGTASEARMLVTYVPAEGIYKSWWFDSISPSVVAQSGKFVGDALVLESEPYPSGEVIRSTWKPAPNGLSVVVASGSKDKFSTMVNSVLTTAKSVDK